MYNRNPVCVDTRGKCFARTDTGRCRILNQCGEHCVFRKPQKEFTNGMLYPYQGEDKKPAPLTKTEPARGLVMTGAEWRAKYGGK